MLNYLIIFLVAYAAGGATVLLFMRYKSRTRLNEAIARTAIVNTQVKSFTRKIAVGTDAAIGKFSELLISINNSIKGTTAVVDSIRAKMSSCVAPGEEGLKEQDLKVIQKRYELMLKEIMDQLNLTIQRKGEDIFKLDFIRESADKIKPFSSEIASIAFATKMISLNASIEAARAGEHGRTFEVVAAEIRKLAQRSTNSAEEMENSLNQIVLFIETAIAELKEAIDVEARFINSTVVLLQDVVMSVVESFVSISEAIEKTLGDSSTFRDEVNAIVFNLQFEDICNQMSQHTVHILDTIKENLESLKVGKDIEEKKGDNLAVSIGDKILNSAKNLFTMEEERELARDALGVSHKRSSESEDNARASKKETKLPESSSTANYRQSSDKVDGEDVLFFDDPSDGIVDDDVTFFDDADNGDLTVKKRESSDQDSLKDEKEKKSKGEDNSDSLKKRDYIEFDEDDDVTFF
ncbi:MAG: hypothetical protein HQK62_13835 [Desulfamplus sp.]|nr:hypothetical protein [Desulfamplus sp.]